jgi:diguanylate cyclase (GGDEF)-like protein
LAVTDALTELYNHRFFQEKMSENFCLCERYGNHFSIIMIDIDHFKKFNDTYGHQSGDIVLKQVAATIKKNVRSTDIPCRYGGEEMTVILTNTNKEDAITTANKICQAVREREFILANGENVHVTISVGVATSNVNGSNPQELIEYADKCLYVAKENGRNQVVVEINP